MNGLQQWINLQREMNQTMWSWIDHDMRIKSEERFRNAFGYPGEHPDDADKRRYLRDKKDSNEL